LKRVDRFDEGDDWALPVLGWGRAKGHGPFGNLQTRPAGILALWRIAELFKAGGEEEYDIFEHHSLRGAGQARDLRNHPEAEASEGTVSSVVVAVERLAGASFCGVVERVGDAAVREQIGPQSAGLVERERVGWWEAECQVYPGSGCWPDRVCGDLLVLCNK